MVWVCWTSLHPLSSKYFHEMLPADVPVLPCKNFPFFQKEGLIYKGLLTIPFIRGCRLTSHYPCILCASRFPFAYQQFFINLDIAGVDSSPWLVLPLKLQVSTLIIGECWIIYGETRYNISTAQGGGGSFKNRKRIGEIDCCEWRMSKQKHWPTD